jgi:hypothetical protein
MKQQSKVFTLMLGLSWNEGQAMNDTMIKNKLTVAPVSLHTSVKKSVRTSPPFFIISESSTKNRRAEVLAAAYRYILSDEWGKV